MEAALNKAEHHAGYPQADTVATAETALALVEASSSPAPQPRNAADAPAPAHPPRSSQPERQRQCLQPPARQASCADHLAEQPPQAMRACEALEAALAGRGRRSAGAGTHSQTRAPAAGPAPQRTTRAAQLSQCPRSPPSALRHHLHLQSEAPPLPQRPHRGPALLHLRAHQAPTSARTRARTTATPPQPAQRVSARGPRRAAPAPALWASPPRLGLGSTAEKRRPWVPSQASSASRAGRRAGRRAALVGQQVRAPPRTRPGRPPVPTTECSPHVRGAALAQQAARHAHPASAAAAAACSRAPPPSRPSKPPLAPQRIARPPPPKPRWALVCALLRAAAALLAAEATPSTPPARMPVRRACAGSAALLTSRSAAATCSSPAIALSLSFATTACTRTARERISVVLATSAPVPRARLRLRGASARSSSPLPPFRRFLRFPDRPAPTRAEMAACTERSSANACVCITVVSTQGLPSSASAPSAHRTRNSAMPTDPVECEPPAAEQVAPSASSAAAACSTTSSWSQPCPKKSSATTRSTPQYSVHVKQERGRQSGCAAHGWKRNGANLSGPACRAHLPAGSATVAQARRHPQHQRLLAGRTPQSLLPRSQPHPARQ